eukprot:g1112.t1
MPKPPAPGAPPEKRAMERFFSGPVFRFYQRYKILLIVFWLVVVVSMSACAGALLRTAKKQAPIGRENIDEHRLSNPSLSPNAVAERSFIARNRGQLRVSCGRFTEKKGQPELSFLLLVASSDERSDAPLLVVPSIGQVFILDDSLQPCPKSMDEITGLLGVAGPQVTPGYVERLAPDGPALIGAGPLSQDMFKVIDGEWVLVPKDIIKMRPDNSIVSIGRGGGTVKVRGGVLMATNVAELQLTAGAVSACCITEPLHVEGGASVVLELQPGNPQGLRKSLQDASFLRMPILYTCKMPRNESTGKVQKSLVQELRVKEARLEAQQLVEQGRKDLKQVSWYWRITKPVLLVVCGVQPRTIYHLCQALLEPKVTTLAWALLSLGKESVLQFCLTAWTYGAIAQAGSCGKRSFGLLVPLAVAGLATRSGILLPGALLACVLLYGQEKWKGKETWPVRAFYQKVGRLSLSVLITLLLRLPIQDGKEG